MQISVTYEDGTVHQLDVMKIRVESDQVFLESDGAAIALKDINYYEDD